MTVDREKPLKCREEIMQILEAFDLTGSLRAAGELSGCSHHTVAEWVAKRDAGLLAAPDEPVRRERMIDPFLPKIEEWVERSKGKVRADVAFRNLRRVGFIGSGRDSPAGLWPRSRRRIAAGGGCIGRGSPSRACGPMGLGRRTQDRRAAHEPVLRLAGLVASSGCDRDVGSDVANGDRACRKGRWVWGGAPTYWSRQISCVREDRLSLLLVKY